MGMHVDENTIIGDLLDQSSACAEVLLSFQMACRDCPASRGETIAEACEIHGVNPHTLLAKLRQALGAG